MAEQNNNAVMIQLPWTVPQQPFDQTASVVENPNRKMELDLNHSTDTTAISPFTLSVIIALILGSFATWLAYWYGCKSFQLTELSFKVVSEDIKEAAESHRNMTKQLIESQEKLKRVELQEEFYRGWKLKLIDDLAVLKPLVHKYITLLGSVALVLNDVKDWFKNNEYEDMRSELKSLEDDIFALIARISTHLKMLVEEDHELVSEWDEFERYLTQLQIMCITAVIDKEGIADSFKALNIVVDSLIQNLKSIFNKKAA